MKGSLPLVESSVCEGHWFHLLHNPPGLPRGSSHFAGGELEGQRGHEGTERGPAISPSPNPPLWSPLPQTLGTFCLRSFFCSPTRAAMLSRAEATSGGSTMSGGSSPVSESFSLSSLV